jgi:hypothetical protein
LPPAGSPVAAALPGARDEPDLHRVERIDVGVEAGPAQSARRLLDAWE